MLYIPYSDAQSLFVIRLITRIITPMLFRNAMMRTKQTKKTKNQPKSKNAAKYAMQTSTNEWTKRRRRKEKKNSPKQSDLKQISVEKIEKMDAEREIPCRSHDAAAENDEREGGGRKAPVVVMVHHHHQPTTTDKKKRQSRRTPRWHKLDVVSEIGVDVRESNALAFHPNSLDLPSNQSQMVNLNVASEKTKFGVAGAHFLCVSASITAAQFPLCFFSLSLVAIFCCCCC